MSCYKPIRAWHVPGEYTPRGKPRYRLRYPGAHALEALWPCNRCIGCDIDHGRDWTTRLTHEAAMHENSWFLTLTYDDEHLPYGNTLVKEHSKKLIRALRDHFRKNGERLRHYTVGEYGGKMGRPHYHAILFGPDFPDKQQTVTRNGKHRCFESPLIKKLWGKGFHELAVASPDTMAYVAKYATKKTLHRENADAFIHVFPETGEMYEREPEFAHMSRGPGIGARWLDKYASDVFPDDFVVVDGAKVRVPRYYTNRMKDRAPELIERVQAKRKEAAENQPLLEQTTRRRRVKETVAHRRVLGGTNIGAGKFKNKRGATAADLQKDAKL